MNNKMEIYESVGNSSIYGVVFTIVIVLLLVGMAACASAELTNRERRNKMKLSLFSIQLLLHRMKLSTRSITIIFLAFIALIISSNTIDEGERGVITRLGSANRVAEPGLHFKIPFIESIHIYSVRARKFERQGYKVASKETLLFDADVSFVWKLNPSDLIEFYGKYGAQDRFEFQILTPLTAQHIKETTGEYSSSEIIPKRGELAASLLTKLQETGKRYNIEVFDVSFNNLNATTTVQTGYPKQAKCRARVNSTAIITTEAGIEISRVSANCSGRSQSVATSIRSKSQSQYTGFGIPH